MIRNYFKIAWRNLIRNKLFSSINIAGLSLGVAACFIIMLYVQDELSYDKFHEHAPNIVRMVFRADINGGKINESIVMAPVAQTMVNDFPEVQDATRLLDYGYRKWLHGDDVFEGDRFAFADPNVFSIFTLPMVEGNSETALLKPHTVVITQSTARKYFGEENAIGKTIVLTDDGNQPYVVTGVIEDIPVNSHFHFDLLGSMVGYADAKSDSWMYGGFHTYLLLRSGSDLEQLEARFPQMVKTYMGPQIQEHMGISLEQFTTQGNRLGFDLQPLSDIHLNSYTTTEFQPGGNKAFVYIFSGIALFMVAVACINFVNLSTAGASKRAKEVGIRKVVGSGRFQLIKQFLSESTLISCFSLMVAFILVQLVLPAFNHISGKELTIDVGPTLALVCLGMLVGAIAGIYPAFYLSSFKPVAVLKGKPSGRVKTVSLRSGLVVFQFFVSVTLIIGTIVVYEQMRYIQNKDLGFDKEQLITIPNSYALGNNEQVFKRQLLQDSRVVSATASWYKPAGPSHYNNALAYPQGNDKHIVNGVDYHVDEDYIPTLGMHIIQGRNFSKDLATDSSGIIVNETAARALGWDASIAVGKTIIRQNSPKGDNFPFRIVGVVKNFHFKSLHEAISPLFLTLHPEGGLIFKINTPDISGLLATMEQQWDDFGTGEPFTYAFMDDLFRHTYAAEQETAIILNMFTVLTILVACLGLFGLATFTAEQRIKEIGIRKVLGATVTQVTQLLSKGFLKLVLVASLIAFPIAWFAMDRWLANFAYRIEIQWWMFALAGLVAVVIALLTISGQAIRAAVANPVESLRDE
ncbi:MAG TPA: ABC transporter permease [Parapedobacter sp.]|uniref:ABC transporter permease n=1 Tax=Parapedobacter sp. TaxID=1958893 RepID=UPI002C76C26A|nr:ABC transporter permease [Parapedobacter sp.]HWK58851.1 ABC transporter permease [Parapedobacter sp.]